MSGSSFKFTFNLANRVRNVSLSPTQENALLPIFEAVSNSIHSIEERFGRDRVDSGEVIIDIETNDSSGSVDSVIIEDNGIGLNARNWKSFRTSDSPAKLEVGGKGVGRLAWLKVFRVIHVSSVFRSGGQANRRTFRLKLDENRPIDQHSVRNDAGASRGTKIELRSMIDEYASAFPRKLNVVANRIVGHFLPIVIAQKRPRIALTRNRKSIDIQDLLRDAIRMRHDEILNFRSNSGTTKLQITHLILDKKHRFSSRETNWIFFVGNGRVADRRCIDGQLGLKLLREKRDSFYVAYVTGDLLDRSVNTERTGFSLEKEALDKLQTIVRDSAKKFLDPSIKSVRQKQSDAVVRIIRRDPVLREFRSEIKTFVEKRLRLNAQKEEDIYIELYRHHYRRSGDLRKEEEDVSNKTRALERIPVARVTRLANGLSRQAENALASYIRHRYRLLRLLDERLTLQESVKDGEDEKYALEKEVHELIAPLRVDSRALSLEENNVWLLDDRLPFYKYFASDVALRNLKQEIKSSARPDIIFFDKHFGFSTGGMADPVILVEFKRPGRDDYSQTRNNPVSQLIDYLRDIREKRVNLVDLNGRHQSSLSDGAWIHGFIVADLTKSLRELLENYTSVTAQTHNGLSYVGFYDKHKLIVQVISYKLLVAQAAARNQVFFDKLGLDPLQF